MLKLNDKITIGFAVVSTALLVLAMACSIYFAAFTASKTATTTLQFHNGITLTVTGIQDNAWIYNTTGNTGTNDFNTPTTNNPVDGLALSGISVTANTDCYVRVFAVITTNASLGSDLSSIIPTLGTDSRLRATSLLTAEESFEDNTEEMLTYTASVAGTAQLQTGNLTINLLQPKQIFQVSTDNPISVFNGCQLKAYVCIYASTDDGQWGSGYEYSFTIA